MLMYMVFIVGNKPCVCAWRVGARVCVAYVCLGSSRRPVCGRVQLSGSSREPGNLLELTASCA